MAAHEDPAAPRKAIRLRTADYPAGAQAFDDYFPPLRCHRSLKESLRQASIRRGLPVAVLAREYLLAGAARDLDFELEVQPQADDAYLEELVRKAAGQLPRYRVPPLKRRTEKMRARAAGEPDGDNQ